MVIIRKMPRNIFRNCLASELVRDYTTFHLFFDWEHTPQSVPSQDQLQNMVRSLKPLQKECKRNFKFFNSKMTMTNSQQYP